MAVISRNVFSVRSAFVAIAMTFIVSHCFANQEVFALQQVAGKIELELMMGEAESLRWGLLSDSERSIDVQITAEGEGAEFLSFPTSVSLEPKQLAWVNVNVTVPENYSGPVELQPSLLATEKGTQGGSTVINIQMKKTVVMRISPNTDGEMTSSLRNYAQLVMLNDKEMLVSIESASDVTDFAFDEENKRISFKVSGPDGSQGSTIVHVGKLLEGPYLVTIDEKNFDYETITPKEGGQTLAIKLDYPHSVHDISISGTKVVPEFPTSIVVMAAGITILMMARHCLPNKMADR